MTKIIRNANNFQQQTESILRNLKLGKKIVPPSIIFDTLPNGKKIKMYVITKELLYQDDIIKLLSNWRDKSNKWFPAQFRVTFEGTKKWAKEQLLEKNDRILFFLQLEGNTTPFGHVGLYRFDYKKKSCEIDNVIRGNDNEMTKGGMTVGLQMLINWTKQNLGIKSLYLKVVSDNKKAISLYQRVGFKEVGRVPLEKKINNDVVNWIEAEEPFDPKNVLRYFVSMLLKNK